MLVRLLRLTTFCRPLMLLVFLIPVFIALRSLTALSGLLAVLFFLLLVFFLTTRATLTVFIILILVGGLPLSLLGLSKPGSNLPGV